MPPAGYFSSTKACWGANTGRFSAPLYFNPFCTSGTQSAATAARRRFSPPQKVKRHVDAPFIRKLIYARPIAKAVDWRRRSPLFPVAPFLCAAYINHLRISGIHSAAAEPRRFSHSQAVARVGTSRSIRKPLYLRPINGSAALFSSPAPRLPPHLQLNPLCTLRTRPVSLEVRRCGQSPITRKPFYAPSTNVEPPRNGSASRAALHPRGASRTIYTNHFCATAKLADGAKRRRSSSLRLISARRIDAPSIRKKIMYIG